LNFSRLPQALRSALAECLGPDVERIDLIEHSWHVRWHPRALATTRPNRIYLRGSIEEFAWDADLVLHEYFHVLEQWRPRRLTRFRYVWEWVRRGYRNNRFEVEACEFVAGNGKRFRQLIAAQSRAPFSPDAARGGGTSPASGRGGKTQPS